MMTTCSPSACAPLRSRRHGRRRPRSAPQLPQYTPYNQGLIIPQSKVDLTQPVNEFAHKVKEWDLRRPGMDIAVRHLLVKHLPAWVRQAAPGAAKPPLPGGGAEPQPRPAAAAAAGPAGALAKRHLAELNAAGGANGGEPPPTAKRQATAAAAAGAAAGAAAPPRRPSAEEEGQAAGRAPLSRSTSELQVASIKEAAALEEVHARARRLPACACSPVMPCCAPKHAAARGSLHVPCCGACVRAERAVWWVLGAGAGGSNRGLSWCRSSLPSLPCPARLQGAVVDTAEQRAASAEAGLAAVGDSSVADWTVMEEQQGAAAGAAAAGVKLPAASAAQPAGEGVKAR